jgi:hypothetical protein
MFPSADYSGLFKKQAAAAITLIFPSRMAKLRGSLSSRI